MILRGPAAFVGLVLVVAGILGSFWHTWQRQQQRRQLTRTFLTIETPGVAMQLALAEQRVKTQTGRFTTDADLLIDTWAAQFGDERLADGVRSQFARHRIDIAAGTHRYKVTVYVKRRGGAAYAIAADTAHQRVTKTCGDDIAPCHNGTFALRLDDQYLLN
jgi:hypothetical protein